jgi:regulator of sigma E protease
VIQTPGFFWTLLFFLLAIGPLVFVHELGHYLVGRWCGVKADVFSIGFGNELVGWTDKRGTRWKIGWLPLGGYVRFAGDMNPASEPDPNWMNLPEAERNRTFQSKSLWQRALIVSAGPVTNFLVAILILMGFALAYGQSKTPPIISQVMPGSAAEKAGFLPGDKIMEIDDRTISRFDDIYPIVENRAGMELSVDILRKGQMMTVRVAPMVVTVKDRFGGIYKVGKLGLRPPQPVIVPVSLIEAPVVAVKQTAMIVDMMVSGIGQIITGKRSVKELGGPIKIAQVSGQVATLGFDKFVFLVALISINLGFINLLPVPMLDGGHLTFYALEAIRRKPTSARTVEMAFRTGLVAMLGLMVFVTFNDLASLGVWSKLAGLVS